MKVITGSIFVCIVACIGSPGAPPTPPAELPSVLRLPSSIYITVDSTRTTAPAPSSLSALVGSGGEFSNQIVLGAELAFFGQQSVDVFLQPLPQLVIPVSVTTTTFRQTVPSFVDIAFGSTEPADI